MLRGGICRRPTASNTARTDLQRRRITASNRRPGSRWPACCPPGPQRTASNVIRTELRRCYWRPARSRRQGLPAGRSERLTGAQQPPKLCRLGVEYRHHDLSSLRARPRCCSVQVRVACAGPTQQSSWPAPAARRRPRRPSSVRLAALRRRAVAASCSAALVAVAQSPRNWRSCCSPVAAWSAAAGRRSFLGARGSGSIPARPVMIPIARAAR